MEDPNLFGYTPSSIKEQNQELISVHDAEFDIFKASLNAKMEILKQYNVEEVDREKWKTEQIKKWQKQDLKNRLDVGAKLIGGLAALNEAGKGSAILTARLQQVQAVINGIASVQAALAPPPVGYGYTPLGIAASAAATVKINKVNIWPFKSFKKIEKFLKKN